MVVRAPNPSQQTSDKALALGLCRKIIPTKKAVKQVKYLLGGKKSVVHVDKHMGRLRERERERERVEPSKQFKSLLWGISSEFPLANHFDLSVPEPIFGLSQEPLVCAHLLAKMDSREEVYKQLTSFTMR